MIPVKVRNVKIGEGIPKICVPIVGTTKEAIVKEAESFRSLPLDIVEWRVDWFDSAFEIKRVLDTAKELRQALGDIPVLFTFRTLKEGGEKAIEEADYISLNIAAAQSGYVDLIDVEAFTGDATVKKMIEMAHKAGVKVVASNHDFDKTPEKDDMIKRLCKMQELGADIAKIAVMPNSKRDVLNLLEATLEMTQDHAAGPIITMSMAGTGVVSRIAGETFGSALTFGAAKKVSAPGQIGVRELAQVLAVLHKGA